MSGRAVIYYVWTPDPPVLIELMGSVQAVSDEGSRFTLTRCCRAETEQYTRAHELSNILIETAEQSTGNHEQAGDVLSKRMESASATLGRDDDGERGGLCALTPTIFRPYLSAIQAIKKVPGIFGLAGLRMEDASELAAKTRSAMRKLQAHK